jgi:hypothetical protein
MSDYQTLLQAAQITPNMTQMTARQLTVRLLRDKGLDGWTVSWSHAKGIAGTCNHRSKVITLSKYLLAQRSYEDSLMTITHEIAHALTPGHKHDRVWVMMHRSMGGNGTRCHQHVDQQAPIMGRCGLGCEIARYKAITAKTPNYRCRKHGKRIEWESNR